MADGTPPELDLHPPRPLGVATARALGREVLRLAWPAILQGVVATGVFLTDRLMLGRYGADALASMQVSGPFLWSLTSVFTAFSAGTLAVVGRAVGAEDADRARHATASAIALAVGIGAAVGLAGYLARPLVATLLASGPATSPAVRALSEQYLGVILPVIGLGFVGLVATTVLQASGDTRTPLVVAIVAQATNVGLDWVLIYGKLGAPRLGVEGAAIATAASFVLEGVILVAVLLRRRHAARLVVERPTARHRAALGSILRVSRASFGEQLLFHAGFLTFVALVGRLGDTAMAANQALIAIESIGFIAAEGFGIAAGALVAQKLGARRPDDAARAGWVATGIATTWLLGISALFVGLPRQLIGLFSTDPAIVALGAKCLLVAAVAQPLMAVTDSLANGLRGAGDTRTPMIAALVGPVAVRVAGTWLFAFVLGWGLIGVWVGSTLDWGVRAVWLAVVFGRGRWRSLEV